MLEEHHTCKLLSDDTRLSAIHDDDRRWLVHDWLPRAYTAGLRFVASKRPVAHFGRVAVDDIRSETSEAIEFRSFDELGAARGWLTSCKNGSAQ